MSRFKSTFVSADPPLPHCCWVFYPFLLLGTDENIQRLPFRDDPGFRTREIEEILKIDHFLVVNEAVKTPSSKRFLEKKPSGPNFTAHTVRHDDQISDLAEVLVGLLRAKKTVYVLSSLVEIKKVGVFLACGLWSYLRFSESKQTQAEIFTRVESAMHNFLGPLVDANADFGLSESRIFSRYRRPFRVLMIGAESAKYLFSSEIEMELLDLPKYSSVFTSQRRGVDTLIFEKLSSPGKHSTKNLKCFQLVFAGGGGTDVELADRWVTSVLGMTWDEIYIFESDLASSSSNVNATIAAEVSLLKIPVWVHNQKRKVAFDGDFEKV